MARIVNMGNGLGMTYAFAPPQSPQNYAFIQNYYDGLVQTVGAGFQSAVQAARNVFESAYNFGMELKAKLGFEMGGNNLHPDSIIPLWTLDDLRQAQPMMQRFVMSDPFIRQRYLDQQCSGYVDTYVNHHGDAIGVHHMDYRIANEGMVYEDKEGNYIASHYYVQETMEEGDRTLLSVEKAMIAISCMTARALMEDGIDPTEQL